MWGAWLCDCTLWEPSYFHVISWTEWVQRQIFAAGLYYRHNESQIRGIGKCMCMHVCWGKVKFCLAFFFKRGRGGGKENDSKHICPRFVCSYNTKPQHGPVQISFKCTTAACRYSCQTLGKSLSPRYDGSPRLGNTNIDSVGINKQVADAWITAWAAAVRRSRGS